MPVFNFEYKKTIVVEVEADSEAEAREKAFEKAQTENDGAWDRAEAVHVCDLDS